MTEQLNTPLTHKVIASPLGRLFHSRVFERFKIAAVDREFGALRARAAADLAGEDVDAFLDELAVAGPVDASLRETIADALQSHSAAKAEYDRLAAEWDDVFWGDGESTIDERTRLEKARRGAGGRWVSPQKTFGFAVKHDLVDIVAFDVPDPASTLERLGALDGATVYGPPDVVPEVDVSQTVRGPGTREYLVRFPSPSRFLDDTAYARVYEPASEPTDAPLPTIIFGTGLAMACDVMEYWTEEEYVGRDLAPGGFRVVLPVPPWHGQREIPGYYTGEPYLAGMPETAVHLYEAQVKEIAVLVQWLRSRGAPAVGVGGISLGGIVSAFVAAHADAWPAEMRPDFAVPVAASADVAELLFEGSLTQILGVTDALSDAGWSPESLSRLGNVLAVPSTPGIGPDRVYPVGGLADEMTQYSTMRRTLDEWGVPEENRLEWDCGHFGVALRAMRTDAFQDHLTRAATGHVEGGRMTPAPPA